MASRDWSAGVLAGLCAICVVSFCDFPQMQGRPQISPFLSPNLWASLNLWEEPISQSMMIAGVLREKCDGPDQEMITTDGPDDHGWAWSFLKTIRAILVNAKRAWLGMGVVHSATRIPVKSFFFLLVALVLIRVNPWMEAAVPFFKPNDVVAFVGGEDMVAMAEYGHLESLLVRALPDCRMKFRSLAWEGDTVFEQPRDLNFPTLEQQLDEIAATVVIAQFGQMESLAGEEKLPAFTAAYEKLIDRLSGGGKRRIVLVGPTPVAGGSLLAKRFKSAGAYAEAIREIAQRRGLRQVSQDDRGDIDAVNYRDGMHLSETGQIAAAVRMALGDGKATEESTSTDVLRLTDAIRAKNRLWFHYSRPQNWAFLNGDRTKQPSSRDHVDPSKRWFPEEMKQWLPLIEEKEREIWNLAGQIKSK